MNNPTSLGFEIDGIHGTHGIVIRPICPIRPINFNKSCRGRMWDLWAKEARVPTLPGSTGCRIRAYKTRAPDTLSSAPLKKTLRIKHFWMVKKNMTAFLTFSYGSKKYKSFCLKELRREHLMALNCRQGG